MSTIGSSLGVSLPSPASRAEAPRPAWAPSGVELHNRVAAASAQHYALGHISWSEVVQPLAVDEDGNAIVDTSAPTYTKQTFGSKQDALNWGNWSVDEVVQQVDRYNGFKSTLAVTNWEAFTPEQVEESKARLESQASAVLQHMNNFSNFLKASFQVSGPLWTISEDGQMSLNAFKVKHSDHGTLVRVDAAGTVHTPGGTPQDPWRLMNGMPPEGRIVNAVV